MENDVVIRADHVSKRFKVYFDRGFTLKELTLFSNRRRYEQRTVLDDISFSVRRGEAVGIIGRNGSGKSTTLKLLSRILYPDTGSVKMNGRVSALIELGAGFHPDLSGRENIYNNAAIFGLTKKEIDNRVQQIIDFSELGEYIENPVRTYSSGMYMRLAFSVAINVDADILLVDEILSVGDASFQAKCFHKMQEIKAAGTTIVIISHSLSQIEQICERSIWIDRGKIRMEGKPMDVHPVYLDYMGGKTTTLDAASKPEEPKTEEQQDSPTSGAAEPEPANVPDQKRWGTREIEIGKIAIINAENEETTNLKTGEAIQIRFDYTCRNPEIRSSVIGFGIFRTDDVHCYGSNTLVDRIQNITLNEKGTVTVDIPTMSLLPGRYTLDLAFHKEDGFSYDYWRECVRFSVYSDLQDVGVARLSHHWIIH